MYQFHQDNDPVPKDFVFVFGSNYRSAHGKGAAEYANKVLGYPYGLSEGYYSSELGQAYAIPTKGYFMQVLPYPQIDFHVQNFIEFAEYNPQLNFYVTRVGCGLAGFRNDSMARLFRDSPPNCNFAMQWKPYLSNL